MVLLKGTFHSTFGTFGTRTMVTIKVFLQTTGPTSSPNTSPFLQSLPHQKCQRPPTYADSELGRSQAFDGQPKSDGHLLTENNRELHGKGLQGSKRETVMLRSIGASTCCLSPFQRAMPCSKVLNTKNREKQVNRSQPEKGFNQLTVQNYVTQHKF